MFAFISAAGPAPISLCDDAGAAASWQALIVLFGFSFLFRAWCTPMTDPSNYNTGRLTADALHLAVSLDSFTTVDWAGRVSPALQRSKEKLAELRQLRHSLTMSRADGAVIDWVLEVVRARLDFLERLDSAMGRTSLENKPGSNETRESREGRVREPRAGVLEFQVGDDRAA